MYVREIPPPSVLDEALDRTEAVPGEAWPAIAAELEARGWRLRARRVWAVEARRAGECEEALAPTRDEAYRRLSELALLLDAPHMP